MISDIRLNMKLIFTYRQRNQLKLARPNFLIKMMNMGDLPPLFYGLEDNFCSLGQSNSYYLNLRENVDRKIADHYLDAVNDLTANRGLLASFPSMRMDLNTHC